ncbi:MAG: hypothetical protein ACFCUR_07425 [Rhodomicrobiaceae bacterium]
MIVADGLPGQGAGRVARKRLFTFNVVVTGICNAHCTYCHYYSRRDRKEIEYHLNPDLFAAYMNFIKHWSTVISGETRYRFSGGDPMTMKGKLFEYANTAYSIVGTKPFVLTAGKALSTSWLESAKQSALSHACISIENPIAPDPGAPDPHKVIDFIRRYNSKEFPLIAGVCVIPPSQFGNLDKIVDWFYDELGHIPVLHEVNYDAYVPPTEQQWHALEEAIPKIVTKYLGKTPLILFPSVSPELAFGGDDAYVFDLDLENMYSINLSNYKDRIEHVAGRLRNDYPKLSCIRTQCSWWEYCDNVKWFWNGDRHHSRHEKLRDYCRFKRIMNDAYYRHLVDSEHKTTEYTVLEVVN